MDHSYLIIAYFSPETLLPVTSIVATVAGIVMIAGRGSIHFIVRMVRRHLIKTNAIAGVSRPHVHLRDHGVARSTRP
jgi:hypothetical protein